MESQYVRAGLAVDDRFSVESAQPRDDRGARPWAFLFSISMILIVCIRFFSENLGLVPGVVQFIDVPLTAIVVFAAALSFLQHGFREDGLRLRRVLYLFILIALVAALANTTRVALLPAAMFVYGFAAPLIFAVAIMNVRLDRNNIELVARTFFWLGVLQLIVGIFYGLPLFIASGNPDYVSGTFGENCYQFTYFLGVWFLYLLAGVSVQSGAKGRRRGQGLAVVFAAVAVFGLFYAAQYRAMLIFFTLVILATLWASPARLSRRALHTVVLSAISVVILVVVGTTFPNLKLLQVFDLFEDSSPVVQSGKVEVAKNVLKMYQGITHTTFVGAGPGTFSSRAYITFSGEGDPEKDAAGPLAASLMKGKRYSTDVAMQYVGTIHQKPIQGGTTASSPRSSYISLAAETGLLGFFFYLAAYAIALRYSYRRLVAAARAGDTLSTRLAFACFGGLLLLLIQALFDNWLETTRVSIPLWILIGLLYALDRLPPEETAPAVDRSGADQGEPTAIGQAS